MPEPPTPAATSSKKKKQRMILIGAAGAALLLLLYLRSRNASNATSSSPNATSTGDAQTAYQQGAMAQAQQDAATYGASVFPAGSSGSGGGTFDTGGAGSAPPQTTVNVTVPGANGASGGSTPTNVPAGVAAASHPTTSRQRLTRAQWNVEFNNKYNQKFQKKRRAQHHHR